MNTRWNAIVAAVTIGLAYSSVASAHWQFTRWGMTPEEVQVAAGGVLTEPVGDERCPQCQPVPLLAGPYSTGEFSFRATYEFDGRELRAVYLKLADGKRCHALQDSLRAQYGLPTREVGDDNSNLHSMWWLDSANGNALHFLDSENLGLSCFIAYSPLASAKGL